MFLQRAMSVSVNASHSHKRGDVREGVRLEGVEGGGEVVDMRHGYSLSSKARCMLRGWVERLCRKGVGEGKVTECKYQCCRSCLLYQFSVN